MEEFHIPAKIIADAATCFSARRAAIMANMALAPTRSETDFPGGCSTFRWCNTRTYKLAVASAVLLCRPSNFLEIGVRRGHCMATAAVIHPNIDLFGFDLWIPGYGGESNPGPDFVKSELHKIGHTGELHLYQGRSQEMVPKFHSLFPDTKFDLIGVDGSHDAADAALDLELCLKLLAHDGILIFDDITHPGHPELFSVWQKLSEGYERHEVTGEGGFGILRNTKYA